MRVGGRTAFDTRRRLEVHPAVREPGTPATGPQLFEPLGVRRPSQEEDEVCATVVAHPFDDLASPKRRVDEGEIVRLRQCRQPVLSVLQTAVVRRLDVTAAVAAGVKVDVPDDLRQPLRGAPGPACGVAASPGRVDRQLRLRERTTCSSRYRSRFHHGSPVHPFQQRRHGQ